MIASFVLIARDATFGAHFRLHTLLPLLEFLVMHATFGTGVCRLPTFQADSFSAFTSRRFLEERGLLDVAITFGRWTPFQLRVHIHIDVQFELQVLLVDLFRSKFANILAAILIVATSMHARDLDHISILDTHHQVLVKASSAEQMITG